MFERNEDEDRLEALHHPFTAGAVQPFTSLDPRLASAWLSDSTLEPKKCDDWFLRICCLHILNVSRRYVAAPNQSDVADGGDIRDAHDLVYNGGG
jgi:hypothetical protein